MIAIAHSKPSRLLALRQGLLIPGLVAVITAFLPLGAAAAHPACDSIRILSGSDKDEVHWSLEDKLVPATRNQRGVVREAFELAPPLLCAAVRRVAFVYEPAKQGVSGKNKSNDRQDLVYLNAAAPRFQDQLLGSSERARVEAMQTVLHESTHAATRLLYTRSKEAPPAWLEWRPDEDLWEGEALALADEAIARTRLEKGVFQEWGRMHASFVAAGLAHAYYGDDWSGVLADAPGFASAYGGEDIAEDIAEIAGWALVSRRFRGVLGDDTDSTLDQACLQMRKESGPSIPARLAAVFTKVAFAHSLGLLDDEAYDECVGRLAIRGDGSGFFTWEDGDLSRAYTSDVEGTLGTAGDGEWVMQMSARGSIGVEDEGERNARIRFTLTIETDEDDVDLVSFPRGHYRIGPGQYPFNTLQITYRKDGDDALAIEVFEGDVLIARGGTDVVEGAVFVRRYINYTELIKVPVPPKTPMLITFRKDNR